MALVHSEGQDRWYFTKEELKRTPSVLSGIDVAKELSYRQQSANLIQDMGQRLTVSQLTINTAIVYMHRFYMFHSFSEMNRNGCAISVGRVSEGVRVVVISGLKSDFRNADSEWFDGKHSLTIFKNLCPMFVETLVLKVFALGGMGKSDHEAFERLAQAIAPCCLFLSAKLEEQPRKLEHVIRVAHACLHRDEEPLDPKSERYLQQAQDLVIHESILLQTLGFELTVDHPHTHVVRITQLVRASKDLAQTSYFMATNSLHLTSFCVQHKPSVVACVCIHLACKWSNWEFPRSSDNKDWWEYVDPTVTKNTLDTICQEFLNIIESCPSRLKRRINTVTIYKGGHRHKTSGESSSKSVAVSNNVTATSSKAESSSASADRAGEKPNEHASESKNNDATLTITSSAAVVETLTSKVTLPPLPPLTTKYANIPSTYAAASRNDTKTKSSSVTRDDSKVVSSNKHKHREHDDSSSPSAKKLKTTHSSSSHSLHLKPGHIVSNRPASQSTKHSSHQSSRPPSGHHSTPKIPSKGSSSHGQSQHSSVKRHSLSSHGSGSHTYSSHTGNKILSTHKHRSGSPYDAKKSSGERHKRPSSSSSGKPRPEVSHSLAAPVPPNSKSVPSSRLNDLDPAKKDPTMTSKHTDGFVSPPGPQRLPGKMGSKLPPLPPNDPPFPRHIAPQPPLPPDKQGAPPPPPPLSLPPPPPPPPT